MDPNEQYEKDPDTTITVIQKMCKTYQFKQVLDLFGNSLRFAIKRDLDEKLKDIINSIYSKNKYHSVGLLLVAKGIISRFEIYPFYFKDRERGINSINKFLNRVCQVENASCTRLSIKYKRTGTVKVYREDKQEESIEKKYLDVGGKYFGPICKNIAEEHVYLLIDKFIPSTYVMEIGNIFPNKWKIAEELEKGENFNIDILHGSFNYMKKYYYLGDIPNVSISRFYYISYETDIRDNKTRELIKMGTDTYVKLYKRVINKDFLPIINEETTIEEFANKIIEQRDKNIEFDALQWKDFDIARKELYSSTKF